MTDDNNEYSEHSRLDPDHYSKCQECYEDHLDLVQDHEYSARIDEMERQAMEEDDE